MPTREQFLQARPLRREAVDVPDVGSVFVQELTHQQFSAWAAETAPEAKDGAPAYDPLYGPKLLTRCVVDAEGVPLFQPEDAVALGQLPVAIINPLVDAAQRLNGFGPKAGDAVKNSERA